MVVFWSVVLVCRADERVYFCANSEGVEVCHVEDVESLLSGPICVRGGRFMMILISFFCVLISGCRYVLVGSCVPQIVISP